jgi:hypothetical protein
VLFFDCFSCLSLLYWQRVLVVSFNVHSRQRGVWKEKNEGMHAIVAGTAEWHHLLDRSLSLSLSQASIQALLRLYEGSIKAL